MISVAVDATRGNLVLWIVEACGECLVQSLTGGNAPQGDQGDVAMHNYPHSLHG